VIYFLINNNYHWYDVKLHLPALKEAGMEVGLIQIPHKLDLVVSDANIGKIITYESPHIGRKNFWNPFHIRSVHRQIEQEFELSEDDVLIVYTEYELLNQFFIKKFKTKNAKVFILEEGFATYITFADVLTRLPLKQRIKLAYLQMFADYNETYLNFLNGIDFPQISDRFIDGVFLYRDVTIARNIRKIVISKEVETLESLNSKYVLFLNEKMYEYYTTMTEHLDILHDLLSKLSLQFEAVYFKFHPVETSANKELQKKIINQFSNIQIIESDKAIEEFIEDYRPKYIVSFLSAALLNLYDKGLRPVYCYRYYASLMKNEIFKNIDQTLEKMGYIFPKSMSEIISSPCGFKLQESQDMSLAQFFTKESHLADK